MSTTTPEWGFPLPPDNTLIATFPQMVRHLSTQLEKRIPAALTGAARVHLQAAANAAAAATLDAIDAVNVNAVACFGDSMFADSPALGVTLPGVLAEELGVPVFGGGVGGQTSTEVAVRQGGLDVFLTVQGDTIPPSGTVPVTVDSPEGQWRTTGSYSAAGTLAGVPGTLRHDGAGSFTFTRTDAGDAVYVVPETRWDSAFTIHQNRVSLFRSGRNNIGSDVSLILRDDKAMISGLAGTNNRFLVLSVYNTSSEKIGTATHDKVLAINAARREAFGQNYYDLRGWIIRHGLEQAGITPTAQDLQDIADDVVPSSLRADSTHMNAAGRRVEAEQLARIIMAKGWIVQPPVILTVTNHVANPRSGVDTSGWSVSGGGGTGSGVRVATGGPLATAPTFYRTRWTVPPTSATAQVRHDGAGKNLIEPGKTYTAKAYARASWAGANARIIVGRFDSGGNVVGSAPTDRQVGLTPGQWRALPPVTFTAEPGSVRARFAVQLGSGGALPTTSDTFDVSALFLHNADDRLVGIIYRDGDTEGWTWTGNPHDSRSTGTITV